MNKTQEIGYKIDEIGFKIAAREIISLMETKGIDANAVGRLHDIVSSMSKTVESLQEAIRNGELS